VDHESLQGYLYWYNHPSQPLINNLEDELVPDSFKFIEVGGEEGAVYEVDCRRVTESGAPIDIGGNPSADGQDADEAVDPNEETYIDVIKSTRLCETGFTQKDYTTYIKSYMKKIEALLQKNNPERVESFKKNAQAYVMKVLKNFNDYQFYMGESNDIEGMVVLLGYREDGMTPYCVFWKDGMVGQKY
jgi:Translationally controlled tumour protein